MTAVLRATEPSISFSQTVIYPDNAESKAMVRSNLVDGFILLESSATLPRLSPNVESAGFTAKPLPGFRLYGGSILASGLPMRARSPVFSLYRPFYTPVSTLRGPLFKNSETGDTLHAAAELSVRNTRIAALTNLAHESTDPSWILLSQAIPAFDADDAAITVSALAATRTRTAAASTSDSWFLSDIPLPETRIFMPGLEILVAKRNFSGSCAGFLDLGNLISPAGAIRTEGAFSLHGFSLAGGMYRAAGNFEDLDGSRNSVIVRLFTAPSIIITIGADSGNELKWGGILVNDTVRREKYHDKDMAVVSGGTGLQLETRLTRSEIRVMNKGDETEFAGGLFLGNFLYPSLKLELQAKTVQTRLTESIKKESSLSGKFSVVPVRWFSGSLSGTAGWTTAHDDMDYSVSLSCGFLMKKVRQEWNLGAKITGGNTGEGLTGSAFLKVLLH